jgi:type III secretory pathway component EscU
LNQYLNDRAFPRITYRRGASGEPVVILRGAGLRVQTLVVTAQAWGIALLHRLPLSSI